MAANTCTPSPSALPSPVRAHTPLQWTNTNSSPLTSTPNARTSQTNQHIAHDTTKSCLPLTSLDFCGDSIPIVSPIARETLLKCYGNRYVSPTSSGTSSQKKGRTIYKTQQVCRLEQMFTASHYPEAEVIEALAAQLGISEAKIKVSKIFVSLSAYYKL